MRSISLMSFLLALSVSGSAHAQIQQPTAANAAPLPTALTAAKKIFIGNAGDQQNADCLRVYNDFYQGVNALGRFQLVLDPAQADLVVELHYEIDLGASIVSNSSHGEARQFRIAILDPKTRVILWTLTEHTNYALFQKNRDKNLDGAVAALVDDFHALTGPNGTAPNNKSHIVN